MRAFVPRRLATLISALIVGLASAANLSASEWDIAVYGSTAGGVIAAVEAGRAGKRTVLIAPAPNLGGMTSSGLGLSDTGKTGSISGLADEFYARIYQHYLKPESWRQAGRAEFVAWMPLHWGVDGRRSEQLERFYIFEPHVAEKVFLEMLKEAGVKLIRKDRLELEHGVDKSGVTIRSIRLESGERVAAKVFIDATYEGDLMARAGVTYRVGRESNRDYGETLNGKYPRPSVRIPIDPYVVPGKPESGLLPPVIPQPPGAAGDGDDLVQSYNFRICLTDSPDNLVPITRPENYDSIDYEGLARFIASKRDSLRPGRSRTGPVALGGNDVNLGVKFDLMPNRKTDCNDGSVFGSDLSNGSQGWPEGDYATREKIWRRHKDYLQGLLWFLGNDPRVPETIRTEMKRWGLPKDEFADNGHWPYQLYVREARRMVSDYVMTEHDARGTRVADDAVALGSYPLDSHSGKYYVDASGALWRESGFYVDCRVYPISYRAIRPRKEECTNLLVPGCLSATHAAYGSIRMEPVFMMLGQAAAAAASLAIDAGTAVQDVSYPELRARLLAGKVMLAWPHDGPPKAASLK